MSTLRFLWPSLAPSLIWTPHMWRSRAGYGYSVQTVASNTTVADKPRFAGKNQHVGADGAAASRAVPAPRDLQDHGVRASVQRAVVLRIDGEHADQVPPGDAGLGEAVRGLASAFLDGLAPLDGLGQAAHLEHAILGKRPCPFGGAPRVEQLHLPCVEVLYPYVQVIGGGQTRNLQRVRHERSLLRR